MWFRVLTKTLMCSCLNLDYKFKIISGKIDKTNLSPPERPERNCRAVARSENPGELVVLWWA